MVHGRLAQGRQESWDSNSNPSVVVEQTRPSRPAKAVITLRLTSTVEGLQADVGNKHPPQNISFVVIASHRSKRFLLQPAAVLLLFSLRMCSCARV